MTEPDSSGHLPVMRGAEGPSAPPPIDAPAAPWLAFYEAQFSFVWRALRRLGVPLCGLDDACQEVFLVAFRRLDSFEARSSIRTWLFGIALRVARRSFRTQTRRRSEPLPESLPDPHARDPQAQLLAAEAVARLYRVLDELDHDKRVTFVMAELEELTAAEIAEIEGIPINTVYSRLRLARRDFERIFRRHEARQSSVPARTARPGSVRS